MTSDFEYPLDFAEDSNQVISSLVNLTLSCSSLDILCTIEIHLVEPETFRHSVPSEQRLTVGLEFGADLANPGEQFLGKFLELRRVVDESPSA